eukprot:9471955-Pyramimonas_sp.AAC.1
MEVLAADHGHGAQRSRRAASGFGGRLHPGIGVELQAKVGHGEGLVELKGLVLDLRAHAGHPVRGGSRSTPQGRHHRQGVRRAAEGRH